MEVCGQAWKEDKEWMSGLAHKRSKGRTFLVRQWCKVCVNTGAGAAACMLSYELDASHEAAENRCTENFPGFVSVSLTLRLSRGCVRKTRVRLFVTSIT